MDINQFLLDRQDRWERLGRLLDEAQRPGGSPLRAQEVDELFALYRLVSSDLNLVQTRTANPAMVDYLEALVARAYAFVVPPRKVNLFRAWWGIVRHQFPAAIRTHVGLVGLAAAVMLAGAVVGFVTTLVTPTAAELFVQPEHLSQSPSNRVAELEAMERGGETRIDSVGTYSAFSTFLFTHNIRVTVLCFALGFTFGIGTVVVLFFNGAMLGCITAMYLEDGVLEFFIAWVGPHGSLELPSIVFGAAGGLIIARTQLNRDGRPLRERLRESRRTLLHFVIGAATLLVIAGAIEGGFSQVNEPTLPYPLKISVACVLFLLLIAYLFVLPVQPIKDERGENLALDMT